MKIRYISPFIPFKSFVIALLLGLPGFFVQQINAQGCGCTNCPQFMPDNFKGDFPISVNGADNPTLGQNGQGVCGVTLHFDHEFLGDLSITLNSPSGQSVTLVGPIGLFGPTNGTSWDISFVPCSNQAFPDPGFTDQWDNNQPWDLNTMYFGSYYPIIGCLEDFNAGPVDGTWTFTVVDGQNNDVGNLYDYEIIFCDPSGILCFSCEADAGDLNQNNVVACQGSADLNLSLNPTYVAPATAPPATEYSYTYVVSDTSGVILAYEPGPDLRAYDAGLYNVCGLSYYTLQKSYIPAPNGSLTVAQLSAQLDSSTAPFCGNISGNCVGVTIIENPADEAVFAEICAPDCYNYYNTDYCQTGTYTTTLTTAQGCKYQATLNLIVHQPANTTLNELVCNGECATTQGFENQCSPGSYQQVYQTIYGCDSTVTLDLQVLAVVATAVPTSNLDCNTPSVQISGAGSSSDSSVNYQWTASNGGHIVGSSTNLNVVVDEGGDYQLRVCRTGGGAYCCDSVEVTVLDNSAVPAVPVVTGNANACPGSSGTYSVANVAGASAYNWTITNGTINAGQGSNTVQVTWNINAASGIICANASNLCGASSDNCLNVSLPIPVGGQITTLCTPTNSAYTVSFPVSGGTAPYTIPGGVISGGIFTSDSILSGLPYSFQISDANLCVSTIISGSFNCSCATSAGNMSLMPLTACENDTVQAVHLGGQALDANDVTAYVLHSGLGTALLPPIFGQNNSGSFSFQPGMVYGQTYYISLVAGNNLAGLPDPNDPCLSVAQGQPITFFQNPVANAGMDHDTCGLTQLLSANTGGGTGVWAVISGSAVDTLNIVSPQNPNTAVIASGYSLYTLSWTLNKNGCIDADTVVLDFNPSPSLSNEVYACDGANENYTVTFEIGGGSPGYTLSGTPGGVNIPNGYQSDPIPNGGTYNYMVIDTEGCVSPPLTGSFSCSCATNAGAMDLNLLSTCEGGSITAQHLGGQTLDANDTVSFVLHTLPGSSLGQILDQNTSGVFSFVPGMVYGTTYYVSYVVGNKLLGIPNLQDPCLSVAPGQPVQWLEKPSPNAGADLMTCGQSVDLQAVNGTFNGSWSQVSGPGTASFIDGNDPGSAVNVSVAGNYLFRWTELNGVCPGTDEVNVVFHALPEITAVQEICNGSNTAFNVVFTVSNGLAPYSISGLSGSFTGNQFNSLPLPNNSSYAFFLEDANGCQSPDISGAHYCACATDAGSMETTPASFCANLPATATWNNDASTDSDDLIQFILHDAAGAVLGNTVYATSNQPSFIFGGSLQLGITYYISAIAGNNVLGQVDLNDPCLSVTPGTPVQWKPLPNATLSGDATLCLGGNTLLSFNGSGVYPLTIQYSDGQNLNNLVLTGAQTVTLEVTPFVSTTYSLLNVSDGATPNCSTALSGAVTVVVNQPVNAGTPSATLEFCFGASELVQLSSLLSGADVDGQWTETSTLPSQAGAFNAANGSFQVSGQAPGLYSFQYKLTALSPCTNDASTVTVRIHPAPSADAGVDKTLNCNALDATLDGSSSSTGTYRWILNGDTLGTDRTLSVTQGGNYTLLVRSPEGCTASDAVLVTENNEAPVAEIVSARDVRCFGEHNGAVSVDALTSGHLPVYYSLNGGPFVSSSLFTGLSQGTYVITLQDANGCESQTSPLQVNEPSPLTADLGPDLQLELADSAHVILQSSVPTQSLQSILWQPLLDSLAAGKPYQNFLPYYSWELGVTLTDSSGCQAKDRILVQVSKPRHIYIPNVFKPDADFNHLLYVFGGRDVESIESFQVFDRWGEQVFEQRNFQPNDDTKGWDGRAKGEKVNPGVFVYWVRVRFVDGEVEVFKGDFTVLR